MPRPRPTEVKALIPLLEQDWPDIEDDNGNVILSGQEQLASALIATLDQERASRVSYVGVMAVGDLFNHPVWVGMGPYPGRRSAESAVKASLSAFEASGYVVVPLWSKEGLAARFATLDTPAESGGDWAEVKRDVEAFKNGWRGSRTPGTRDTYLRKMA